MAAVAAVAAAVAARATNAIIDGGVGSIPVAINGTIINAATTAA